MQLNEAKMRMAYQIESTDPNAVLNEIYMTWRLSRNQAARDTAESLMVRLRSLPNKEFMDLIREAQANYRLPGKPQTIREMLAEARQKSGVHKRRNRVMWFGSVFVTPTGSWERLSTPSRTPQPERENPVQSNPVLENPAQEKLNREITHN